MNINEYSKALLNELKDIDREEAENAVNYYTELLQESDDPEAEMKRLGSPKDLASKIRSENGCTLRNEFTKTAGDTASSGSSAGRVIALILTFPFWLTVYILIITLWIIVGAVYFSVVLSVPACLLAFAVNIFGKLSISLEALFLGIFLAGLSVLLFRPFCAMCKGIWILFKGFSCFLFGIRSERNRLTERKPVSKIALLSGTAAAILGLVFFGVIWTRNEKNYDNIIYADYTKEYVQEVDDSFTSLEVYANIGDVKIVKLNEGEPRIECRYIKEEELTIEEGSELKVVYNDEIDNNYVNFNLHSFRKDNHTQINIYLPDTDFERIKTDLSLGDILISGIDSDSFEIYCDCGDSTIENISAKKLQVQNNLGDIDMKEFISDDTSINDDCGDISLSSGKLSGNTVINCSLGDIDINASELENVEVTDDCGDISADDCTVTGGGKFTDDLGDIELGFKGNNYSIITYIDMGDSEINGKKTYSDGSGNVKIEANCSCGDITINYGE